MNAKWIWNNLDIVKDDYSEFVCDFNSTIDKATLMISADTNYAIFLNDKYVPGTQYACFPYNPVYDLIKLKVNRGYNKLRIIVYYCGSKNFSTYYLDKPGLYFTLFDEDNNTIMVSDENIKSSRYLPYESNRCKNITKQLGYSFKYNKNNELLPVNYQNSIIVDKSYNFTLRENKALKLLKRVEEKILSVDKRHILVDLGKEQTGYICLELISKEESNLIVSFGEHLIDSKVRRIIHDRDFSFEYVSSKGINKFTSYLRRVGCRYIEVSSDKDVVFKHISIIPTVYPFTKKQYKIDNELEKKIYETSIYTLECCYHEHYEDCPWREQSFYTLDSRNQILAGYYAFKNREQVRSALKLISLDNRKDNMLSICCPSSFDYVIPSFSLHYFTAIYEYYKYTKDKTLLIEIYPKLEKLINAFISKINKDDNLLYNFEGDVYWNFYEWKEGLDNPIAKTDLILNTLFLISLDNMYKISKIIRKKDDRYKELIKTMKPSINKSFYNPKKKLYYFSKDNKQYTCLGNSLAILSGIANKSKQQYIAKVLSSENDLTKVTLSMKCFLYDALLKVSYDYKDYILNDIDTTYKKMLDDGATTFYETELGAYDFDGAGSLCHGWSAMPIYYYNLFGIVKK